MTPATVLPYRARFRRPGQLPLNIDRDSHGNPITKTEQVKRCGNSVSPHPARALVAANMAEAQTKQRGKVSGTL